MKIKKFPDKVFVGFIAAKNEIEVLERDGELICKSLRDVVLFKQIILLLFGGGLTAGLWFSVRNPAIAHMPLFWTLFMAAMATICWLIFFRNLLGTPRFVVSAATGDIALFRRRTPAPWKTIHASEISHFAIETLVLWDEQLPPTDAAGIGGDVAPVRRRGEVPNAVLVLFTVAGERRPLCGSPERELIESLGEKLARLTQRKVVERSGVATRIP
jgi:hypothetical protein